MTVWPHLNNAPITEALIDIRTQVPPGVSTNDLIELHKEISGEYPQMQERRAWKVELKASGPESKDEGPHGFLFKSKDGTQVVQYRLDGFTFSRLKPYTNWEAVRTEAKRLWDIFNKAFHPVGVTRVAVKYINSITVPASFPMELKDYFNSYPEIPQEMLVGNFLMSSTSAFPDNVKAIVTQASQPPAKGYPTFLLDIDVVYERGIPMDGLWAKIETLRETKNHIFFKFLKEKTLELFK